MIIRWFLNRIISIQENHPRNLVPATLLLSLLLVDSPARPASVFAVPGVQSLISCTCLLLPCFSSRKIQRLELLVFVSPGKKRKPSEIIIPCFGLDKQYVCMHVCACVCMYELIYIYMYMCVCVRTYACMEKKYIIYSTQSRTWTHQPVHFLQLGPCFFKAQGPSPSPHFPGATCPSGCFST